MFYEPDVRNHRKRAEELYEQQVISKKYDIKLIRRSISGYCMLFKKSTWKKVGGFKKENSQFKGGGFFGVDSIFSYDVLSSGGIIGLMEGIYGFHCYRIWDKGCMVKPYKEEKDNIEARKKLWKD